MTPDRKHPSVAFWITVALVAMLVGIGGYAGAYLWMVEPMEFGITDGTMPERPACYVWRGKVLLGYWEAAFEPAHKADKLIRLKKWFRQ